MASKLIAGLGIFKTMMDIAKGLKDVNDTTIRNAAIIELQEKILTARAAQTTLLERVDELEKEVAGFETWETEKQRYKLDQLPPGVFVYSLKPNMANGEPPHRICQTCYQNRKKFILQSKGVNSGLETLICNGCGTEIKTGHFKPPSFTGTVLRG